MLNKAKEISELYERKSKACDSLKNLTSPDYSFKLGYQLRYPRFYGNDIHRLYEIDEEFEKNIKEQCISYLENKIIKIDEELEALLKC